jgi:hypothetical protein
MKSIPALLAAAVRNGHRSPGGFAAETAAAAGGGPASASGASRWIDSIGGEVAEELVHALAREVAEARAREGHLREEVVSARDARNDSQRALLAEVHRVHELERMRVVDLQEVHAAEQRARVAGAAAPPLLTST